MLTGTNEQFYKCEYCKKKKKAKCVCVLTLFHFRENKPKNGGICVANHTTPIDVIILANDGCYSMVEKKFVSECVWLRVRVFVQSS